jgi:hypothetical protein
VQFVTLVRTLRDLADLEEGDLQHLSNEEVNNSGVDDFVYDSKGLKMSMRQYPPGFQHTVDADINAAAKPCDYEENGNAEDEKKKTMIVLVTVWHIVNLL